MRLIRVVNSPHALAKALDLANLDGLNELPFGKYVWSVRQALNLPKLTYVIGAPGLAASGDLKFSGVDGCLIGRKPACRDGRTAGC